MLSKVFIAGDASHGSFQSGLAALVDKTEDEDAGMYLICLYSGESLQWLFRVSSSRAIPVPVAYYDGSSHEDGWWQYHTKCFCSLLIVPESGHVILPSELTGVSGLTQMVFKAEREYGWLCMSFRMGDPTHLTPLNMTRIRVFGSLVPHSGRVVSTSQVGQSCQKHPIASSTPKPQTSASCFEPARAPARAPTSTVSSAAAAQDSPGLLDDFVLMQPQTRTAKRR